MFKKPIRLVRNDFKKVKDSSCLKKKWLYRIFETRTGSLARFEKPRKETSVQEFNGKE